jgi:tRNA(Arg) A34 adenosine deaminase TadA
MTLVSSTTYGIHSPTTVVLTVLNVLEAKIIPLLRHSGKEGNMPFGAAILTKDKLIPITVSANRSRDSPLLHGETNCIREFYENPKESRPDPSRCIFLIIFSHTKKLGTYLAWLGT